MAAWTDGVVGFEDFSVFVDQVADAPRVPGCGVVASAVGKAQGAGRVAQQREGKAEFLCKGRVFLLGIETHSQYFHVPRLKIGDLVAEPATFSGSPRSISFGVKPQQDFFPA